MAALPQAVGRVEEIECVTGRCECVRDARERARGERVRERVDKSTALTQPH